MSSNAPDPAAARRWQRLEALFGEACELPPERRAAWFEALPEADRTLAADLRSLLAAHDRGGDFLEEAVAMAERELGSPAGAGASDIDLDGRTVGAYRVVRLLGRGGMGAVYLAERADQAFRQRVAIKLIPWALASPEARHRFRIERQTLAGLNHPHIARLVDGGETEDGLPYLVMEYVDGEPIDVYCRRLGLDIPQRLRLFREVCGAVEHAHRNLVVHRDIKPANILVTAGGEVKLLDFGIAKLLPGAEVDATMPLTRAGRLMLTPLFASPEQVRGEPVTTATDVYSLGVLLFRLLTGQHPFQLNTTSPIEVARVVCEQPPTRPSTAVPAGLGGLTLPALRRRLRGDLDTIVLTALRKEPERRYASVEQLADDVRRHLAQLPLRARPDTLAYRTSMFARRHRLGLAAAALILLSLLGGLLATLRQARIAERRFGDVRALANSLLFELHDAIAPLPGSTPARQLLVRDGLTYLDRLAAEAGGDPALQLELAAAYQRLGDVQGNPLLANLGDVGGALAAYQKAQQILGTLLRRSPASVAVRTEIARCELSTGDVLGSVGKIAEAIRHYQRVVALRAALAAEAPADRGRALELSRGHTSLANLLAWNGDLPGALVELEKARHILEALRAPAALAAGTTATPANNASPPQATPASAAGAGGPGAPAGHRAASPPRTALRDGTAPPQPSDDDIERELASVWTKTGDALCWEDHCREAVSWHTRSIASLEQMAGRDPSNGATLFALLLAYLKMGEAMEGVEDAGGRLAAYEKTIVVAQRMAAADPRNSRAQRTLALSHAKLGDALGDLRRFDEAQAHYRTALAIQTSLADNDPANLEHRRDLANTNNRIGEAYLAAGQPAAALDSLRAALRLRELLVARDPQDVASRRDPAVSYSNLAEAEVRVAVAPGTAAADRRRHLEQARDLYQRSLAVWADVKARGGFKPADQGAVDRTAKALGECTANLARLAS